jgi:GR25 family glycosyltransferase involved in LPS biosynthesis
MLNGYFINLDRAPDRAAFMRSQLERVGLQGVQRVTAVDGAALAPPPGCPLLPGEYACFLSHLRVLEQAPGGGHTLVLEDDAELSARLPGILAQAVREPAPAFDVALLECMPHFSLAHVSTLWNTACAYTGHPRRTGLLDARAFFHWGTVAYLVPPHALEPVRAVLREGLAEGPLMPVDDCLKRAFLAGRLRGAITVPFLATPALQWHGRSTIGNGARVPGDPLVVLRRLLFAGELGAIAPFARSFADVKVDPALRMLTPVLRDIAADQQAAARRQEPRGPSLPAAPDASPGP